MKTLPTALAFLLASVSIYAQANATQNSARLGSAQTEVLKINDVTFQTTGFGNTPMVATPTGNVIIKNMGVDKG